MTFYPLVRVFFVLLTALLLIGGCRCERPQESRPLRVGLLVWPPYELAVLAREKGYIGPEDVRLMDYRSPAVVTRAFRNGTVDAIFVTTHYFVELEAKRPGNVVIFATNVSDGGDSVLAHEAGSLEGKRIGVEASPLGAYVLDRALQSQGLSRRDVKLVPVDIPQQEEALLQGRVDAVVSYEPVRSRLLEAGAVEIFDSSSIPDEIVDVLVTRKETLKEMKPQLRALVEGWLRAREDFIDDPLAAARLVADREGLSPEEFVAAMRGASLPDRERNFELLSSVLPESTQAVVEHALNTGVIDTSIDLSGSFEPSLVAPK